MEWIYPLLLLGLPACGPILCFFGSKIDRNGAYLVSVAVLACGSVAAVGTLLEVQQGGGMVFCFPPGIYDGPALNVDLLASVMVLLSTALCLACLLVS